MNFSKIIGVCSAVVLSISALGISALGISALSISASAGNITGITYDLKTYETQIVTENDKTKE